MQDFRQLKAWEKAHQMVLRVYKVSREFPKDEIYGLTSQLRRACASIAANLSEGCGRGSDADFARFVHMAMGSSSETEYHLLLVNDLGFLDPKTYKTLDCDIQEIKRMLTSLIAKLKGSSSSRLSADEAVI